MRTIYEPTKWPIPDTVGNPLVISAQHPLSMHPLGPPLLPLTPMAPMPPPPLHRPFPAHPIVPPPLPYTAGPTADNLNPNVPEFVPVIQPLANGRGEAEEAVDECSEATEELESKTEELNINERVTSPTTAPAAEETLRVQHSAESAEQKQKPGD